MKPTKWSHVKGMKDQYIKINNDINDFNDKRQDAYLMAMEKNLKEKSGKKKKRKNRSIT